MKGKKEEILRRRKAGKQQQQREERGEAFSTQQQDKMELEAEPGLPQSWPGLRGRRASVKGSGESGMMEPVQSWARETGRGAARGGATLLAGTRPSLVTLGK